MTRYSGKSLRNLPISSFETLLPKKIKYVLLQLRACSRWRPLITKSMTLKSIESFIFADFNEKLPFYYNFYSHHITLYVVELTFVFTASKKFLKQKGTIECRFSEVFGRRYRKFSSNTYRFDVGQWKVAVGYMPDWHFQTKRPILFQLISTRPTQRASTKAEIWIFLR